MKNFIATPILVGCGVGIALFATMSDLPRPAYLVNIPFWPLVVMPSGLLWRNKILNPINKGQFPPEMRNYRQLLVFSRKAMLYQICFNQLGYHSLIGLSFIGYTYWARAFYDKETARKPFGLLLKEIGLGFCKLRLSFMAISLFSEYWGSKLSIKNLPGGKMHISANSSRVLLIKEMILNIFWMTSVSRLVHQHYSSTEQASPNP